MNMYDPDEVNDNEALTLSEAEMLENGDGIDYWEESMLLDDLIQNEEDLFMITEEDLFRDYDSLRREGI